MALLRCEDHPPADEQWTAFVEPVDYPIPALICSYRDHTEPDPTPALVVLDDNEYALYQRGERWFSIVGTAARIHVSDTVVTEL